MKPFLQISRRDGISLVELLVVMSAASIILSLSAGLIHRVMHAETKARNLAAAERTSLRLSDALRRDVHSAVSAVTNAERLTDGAFLRLDTSASGRIEYHREDNTIHRTQFDNDQTISREQFVFPSNFDVQSRFESPQLVVLTLTSRQPDSDNQPDDVIQQSKSFRVDLQIVAALRGGR